MKITDELRIPSKVPSDHHNIGLIRNQQSNDSLTGFCVRGRATNNGCYIMKNVKNVPHKPPLLVHSIPQCNFVMDPFGFGISNDMQINKMGLGRRRRRISDEGGGWSLMGDVHVKG